MVLEWWNIIWNSFRNFVGDGWLRWGLAIALILVCGLIDRSARSRFWYSSLIIFLIFFNPWIYGTVGIRFMNGMYWRMLWFVPEEIMLAYGIIRMSEYVRGRLGLRPGCAFFVIALVVAICSGSPVFSSETYERPSNYYQLPQGTIDVSDAIIGDMEKCGFDTARAAIPAELVSSVRQYTTRIGLVFGRNAYGYINTISNNEAEYFAEMSKQLPDIENIVELSESENVRYVVFNSSYHEGYESLLDYSYVYVGRAFGYDIYRRP